MSNWVKSPNDNKIKVYLSGALARLQFDQEDINFFLEIAVKLHDDGKLDNVVISKAVQAYKDPQNRDRDRPAVAATALTCFHATKPRANIAVFYRRLSKTQAIIIGYGNHIGNDNLNYKVQWADGSNSSIYLKAKAKEATSFLPYPKNLA